MPWIYEDRIDRALKGLIDSNKLDEQDVQFVRRPLFFGKYSFGIGLSLKLDSWGEWVGIRDRVFQQLKPYDATIQNNRKTYQFNIFSKDPSVIREVKKMNFFTFNHVRIIPQSCWSIPIPKPKPKAKFYGEFGWRFEFKNPKWGIDPENLAYLDDLTGVYKIVTQPRTFLYLSQLSDVLLFKLVAGEQLLSLEDRHTL